MRLPNAPAPRRPSSVPGSSLLRPVRRLVLPVAALMLASSGCYRYDPVPAVTPDAARRVRVDLTDAGSVRLASLVGPSVIALEGTVMRSDAQGITLAVSASVARPNVQREWQGETVVVNLGDVSRLSVRTFDGKRTALTVGGVVGGAVLMARAFGVGVSGSGGPSRGGTSPPR